MAYRIEGCVCFQCFFGVSVNHFKFGRWGIMIQFQIVSSISMWVWLKTVDAPKFKMGCFKFYQDSLPWAISRSTYGDFQTWGVPQNGCFLMDNPSINGWFRGTPISIHGLSIINHYYYQSSIYNGQSIYKWFIMFPHFRNPPFQYMACFKFLSLPKPEQPWEQFHKLHRYPGEPESHGVPGFCIAWVALKNHVMPSLNIINVLLSLDIINVLLSLDIINVLLSLDIINVLLSLDIINVLLSLDIINIYLLQL